MKNFLVNLIKVVLGLLIIYFIEEYFFKFMGLIGLHLNKSTLVVLIISIIEFILIYFIFKEEIKSSFSKYQNKFGNNVLYTLISFVILFITMMITNYLLKLIAHNINKAYDGLSLVNLFNKEFDFNLIVDFIRIIIVNPFVIVSIFVLGINNLCSSKVSPFVSAFIYSIYIGLTLGGKFDTVFMNIIDEFVLIIVLSYIYKKNNNIAFSIITLALYELLSGLLIVKLL